MQDHSILISIASNFDTDWSFMSKFITFSIKNTKNHTFKDLIYLTLNIRNFRTAEPISKI